MANKFSLSRRALLVGATSAPLYAKSFGVGTPSRNSFLNLSRLPDSVLVTAEAAPIALKKNGDLWQAADVEVETQLASEGMGVQLSAPVSNLRRIHLRWQLKTLPGLQYLGDHWERSYGDLGWRTLDPERVLPWYLLAFDGVSTAACGVKTAPAAFCYWQVDPAGVSLFLDIRNGGGGVQLGERRLPVAIVVNHWYPDTKPFSAARHFCHLLSEKPRLPAAPIYGGNNWYYAYGKSSAQAILDDSERIASLAQSTVNRPFMVIDDGWAMNATAGPWSSGNRLFPDMPRLASDMRGKGVRPGLWLRPLFTKEDIPSAWRLNTPNSKRETSKAGAYTLDPTVPDAAARIADDLETAVNWGYEMIKHDFSTYDLLGRWGFTMGAELTDDAWHFADRKLTNAEVIRRFYQTLRTAGGDALLLGCNTVGHLSAGLFEISRTGDDTSGRDWSRTRKMGVNTLAFRAPQHGAFFAVDADCVGLTKQIPWNFNRQWLDLLAHSGTPLFVSASPDALGVEQRTAVKEAFALAAIPQPLIEPSDWLTNTEPEHWLVQNTRKTYDWFGNGAT